LTRERDAHALDAAEARGIFQSRTDRIAELKVLCYTYEDQISERTRQLDQCHKQLEAHGELSQFFSTTQEKLAAEIEALRSEFSLLQVRCAGLPFCIDVTRF
jgi:chromosome segregation ATPase